MSREFSDLIAEWLADAAPGEAPDWIVDRIIDRTAAMPHRHRLRFAIPTPFLATGLTVAVVVLAVVLGIGFGSLLDRSGGPSVESASPSPAASSSPVARPTDIPVDGSCEPERDCHRHTGGRLV
jgi:hypothetical protein